MWGFAAPLLAALLLLSCGRGAEPVELRGSTMGTVYTVKLTNPAPEVARDELHAEIEGVLARINGLMSNWDPESELSRFNASASTGWVPVSGETARVVEEALVVSRLTDGAFDVTVAPLVELWGFGPGPRREGLPSDDELLEARERIGYRRLHARQEEPALRKEDPRLSVDLSAIAKGYAVDQLAEHLESLGVPDYMVEIGGEVRAKGEPPRGGHWRIGIEKPVSGGRSVYRVLHVEGRGVATSGDYRNFVERGGARYSHTIDPRSGGPVTHTLASVTVTADSSMRADALATALLVLGPEEGRALAEREGIAALFITRRGDGFGESWTPAMDAVLAAGAADEG